MQTSNYPLVPCISTIAAKARRTFWLQRFLSDKLFICCVATLLLFIQAKAVTKTSTGTGNWNTAGTWTPSGVPANGDAVIIATGHTVTVNTNTNNLLSLTVNGTLTIGNDNTDRTVTVTGSVIITGTLNTGGNGGNNLNIGGHLTNNGTFDMNIGSATSIVTFNGSTNQTISGTGSATDFRSITINNTGAANNNIIEIMPSNFTAAAGFLTLTDGIIKMSGSYTLTNTFFNAASPTINADEGIWLNNSNITVTGQSGNITLSGLFRITAGTFNIGTTNNNSLIYNNGSIVTIEGGAVNITGLFRGNVTTSTTTYTQSNGIVTVNTVNNTSGTFASFDIQAAGTLFTMSGGFIIMQRPTTITSDYINNSASAVVNGGTVQAGNAATPAGSLFWIESPCAIYNLIVNATNTPTTELLANTIVLNDLTNGGTLTVTQPAPDANINIGHDWINNGTFTQGTAIVTFDGAVNQVIKGSTATTFYNLTISKPSGGGVTLNKPTTIQGAGTFTAGIVTSTTTNLLIFNDNATTSGANNNTVPSFVSGPVRKTGNDAFTFPVGKTGAGYKLCGISAPASATDAFTAELMRTSATSLGPITASGLKRVSACEYWQLDRTTGTSTVNVTLSWNSYSNCNANAYVTELGTLTVAHFNGTSWDTHAATSYTGSLAAGTVTRNGVSVFSPFSLGATNPMTNPLPVMFSMIKAYKVNNGNRIEWNNLAESEVIRYEVERSANGISFNTIAITLPKTNAGHENYNETDEHILGGVNYYRIKAVESGENYIYSITVKVNSPADGEKYISVYPHPVTSSQFTLQLNNYKPGDYNLKLMNNHGQLLMTKSIYHTGGSLSTSIERPATANPGLYILQLTGEGINESIKLVIQ
ncbi:MAG: G8 domain-containing protein [Chitinophagaceae bacterium]